MIKIYEDQDYTEALKQRRKIRAVYFAVAFVYAAICVFCIVSYMSLPYQSSTGTWIKVGVGVSSVLMIFFSFPYLGIKYSRSKHYCKMLKNISTGIKEKGSAYFSHIDDWDTKDKVDVNVLVFKKWNEKRKTWDESNVYVDAEKTLPEFEEDEEVLFVTQGNVLVEYTTTGRYYTDNKVQEIEQ